MAANRAASMTPSNITLYCDSYNENTLSDEDALINVTSRDEMTKTARTAAETLLPGFSSDILQWVAMFLAFAASAMLSIICWRQEWLTLFSPLICIGLGWSNVSIIFFTSKVIVLAVVDAVAVAMSQVAYLRLLHFSMAPMSAISAWTLIFAGILIGVGVVLLCNVATCKIRKKMQRGLPQ